MKFCEKQEYKKVKYVIETLDVYNYTKMIEIDTELCYGFLQMMYKF